MSAFRKFVPTPLAFAVALACGQASALTVVYTTTAQFGIGTMVGVNATAVADQLQLDLTGSSFPVLWIANAGEDTLSKIDSTQVGASLGREVARYRTWFGTGTPGHPHDAWSGAAPSRTAVDAAGNAYVANRGFQNCCNYPGWATVFKVLNNTYIDRNGNSAEDTSRDASADGTIQGSEMKDLVDSIGNNIIDPNEIQDERIAWAVRIPDGSYKDPSTGVAIAPRQNALARALCIGTDGNLWVGMYNGYEYWKISATDGHTMAGPVATSYPNYGCLIDQNGTLWGASWQNGVLTRIGSTAGNTGKTYPVSYIYNMPAIYGLALTRDASNTTHVIMGGSGDSYWEYVDGAASAHAGPAAGQPRYGTYAVGTDNVGNILVSKQNGGVVKYTPAGVKIWDTNPPFGSDSRGVIADANNDVWQVHRASNNMSKYRGTDGAWLGTIPIGYEPYTYSDASGTAALSITTKTGSWDVVSDGGAAGFVWTKVSWSSTEPTGTSVKTEVRAYDTTPAGAFTTVTNGGTISLAGRYLETRVTLNANPQNQSPSVADVTVNGTPPVCDVNHNGKIDATDIALIRSAIGQTPTAGDPRDANGDGKITINDVRQCTLQCTNANCTP